MMRQPLLDILHLLSDLFDFYFAGYCYPGGSGQRGFGKDGVHFTVHFLAEKVEMLSETRRFLIQKFFEVIDVGCQSCQLLADVRGSGRRFVDGNRCAAIAAPEPQRDQHERRRESHAPGAEEPLLGSGGEAE